MKDTKFIRYPDQHGRITIPNAIRKEMGISDNLPLEITVTAKGILLTKYAPGAAKEAQP